jgi:hypothetical protein
MPLSPERVKRTLIAYDGNRAKAAESLGVSCGQLRSFLSAHPGLREAALETIERSLDDAEAELIASLRSSNPRLKIMAAGHILRRSGRF